MDKDLMTEIVSILHLGEDELEQPYLQYSGMVFRLCLRYSNCREDAVEMASKVFARAEQKLEQYLLESKPLIWMYRITVNQCLDHLRIRRSKGDIELGDHYLKTSLAVKGYAELCRAKFALDRLLTKINPTTRRVLFLYHLEGLTHSEISAILNVKRSVIIKKLGRFSELMQHYEQEQPVLGRIHLEKQPIPQAA